MASNFGHVERVTECVGGREITFRSKLEYRWAQWLELEKQQGYILEWWYESQDTLLQIETPYFHNQKLYLPDFCVQILDGTCELHECKGWFTPKDYTKLKLAAQQYKNPITLIFASLSDHSKNSKTQAQYSRAKRLEPFLKRIIYNANRDIFRKAGIK